METVDEIFQTIDAALKKDPSRSQGMNAVYQFNLSGEEEGTYHVVMRPEGSYAGAGKRRIRIVRSPCHPLTLKNWCKAK